MMIMHLSLRVSFSGFAMLKLGIWSNYSFVLAFAHVERRVAWSCCSFHLNKIGRGPSLPSRTQVAAFDEQTGKCSICVMICDIRSLSALCRLYISIVWKDRCVAADRALPVCRRKGWQSGFERFQKFKNLRLSVSVFDT